MQDVLLGAEAMAAWNKPKEIAPALGLDKVFAGQAMQQDLPNVPDSDIEANLICAACDELKLMLLGKNASYGGSAFKDVKIAGQIIDRETALLVRLGDKLRRLSHGHEHGSDDSLLDTAGYIILLMAVRKGKK
jgi:hypothetical protein